MLLHASCVSIGNKGVLIAGPSGAGKSDLALRLIDGGAQLVSDDQTQLRAEGGILIASAPPSIKGLIEIRHVGLLRLAYVSSAPVGLYLEPAHLEEKLERLPEAQTITFLGCAIRQLRLPVFAASTPAKIRAALAYPLANGSP
jgi:HPr kinase/phosphorylase